MTTHVVGRSTVETRVCHGLSVHWAWLGGGFMLAFAVPYLFADVLQINRDLFYGIYALSVVGLFWLWSRTTGYDLVQAVKRRWASALLLGLAAAGVLAAVVVRTEDATARPGGSISSVRSHGAASSTASRTECSYRCSRSWSCSRHSREPA
jgi:hypothetical protein